MTTAHHFDIPVLCYHSWRIEGNDYGSNDHVAMARDLKALKEAGYQLLSVSLLVSALRNGSANQQFTGKRLVCVTFDDGFLYDVEDMTHPHIGLIPSFHTLLNRDDQIPERFDEGPKAVAFVIASDQARKDLRLSSDPEGYWDLRNDWWLEAAQGDTIAIGNHSWDHTHPDVDQVKQREGKKGSFLAIDNAADAYAQVIEAQHEIDLHTRGRALKIFCYPYGDVPYFLQHDFMPTEAAEAGILAAFGTARELVTPASDIWNLPRLVCGQHWDHESALIPLINNLKQDLAVD